MATHEATIHPFPAQGRVTLTITSEQISRYAEVCALLTGLESEQKKQRSELLNLRASGAQQSTESPYLLSFVDQDRRNVDWKALAISLAEKVFGTEGALTWKTQVEASAPVQPITQVRVKANPVYAAGLATAGKPPASTSMAPAVAFGD